MSWFGTARKGAAREFGRRNWRWFAAAEIGRAVARRVLPNLLILTAVLMAVGLLLRYSAWILPRLTLLAATSAALGVALWVWRRWRWRVRAGQYRPVAVATALVLVATVGASVYLLR